PQNSGLAACCFALVKRFASAKQQAKISDLRLLFGWRRTDQSLNQFTLQRAFVANAELQPVRCGPEPGGIRSKAAPSPERIAAIVTVEYAAGVDAVSISGRVAVQQHLHLMPLLFHGTLVAQLKQAQIVHGVGDGRLVFPAAPV